MLPAHRPPPISAQYSILLSPAHKPCAAPAPHTRPPKSNLGDAGRGDCRRPMAMRGDVCGAAGSACLCPPSASTVTDSSQHRLATGSSRVMWGPWPASFAIGSMGARDIWVRSRRRSDDHHCLLLVNSYFTRHAAQG